MIPSRTQQDTFFASLHYARPDLAALARTVGITETQAQMLYAFHRSITRNRHESHNFPRYWGSASHEKPVKCRSCNMRSTVTWEGECYKCWATIVMDHPTAQEHLHSDRGGYRYGLAEKQAVAEVDEEVRERLAKLEAGYPVFEPDPPEGLDGLATMEPANESCLPEE